MAPLLPPVLLNKAAKFTLGIWLASIGPITAYCCDRATFAKNSPKKPARAADREAHLNMVIMVNHYTSSKTLVIIRVLYNTG